MQKNIIAVVGRVFAEVACTPSTNLEILIIVRIVEQIKEAKQTKKELGK